MENMHRNTTSIVGNWQEFNHLAVVLVISKLWSGHMYMMLFVTGPQTLTWIKFYCALVKIWTTLQSFFQNEEGRSWTGRWVFTSRGDCMFFNRSIPTSIHVNKLHYKREITRFLCNLSQDLLIINDLVMAIFLFFWFVSYKPQQIPMFLNLKEDKPWKVMAKWPILLL